MRRQELVAPPMPSLVASVAAAEVGQAVRRTLRRLGVRNPPAVDLARLAPPDSPLATRAAALARELSPPFLYNHCERTFAFGCAVGIALGARPDRELLYVAAILHDLGLTDAYPVGAQPFELRGADAAYAFCVEQRVADDRAALVHEAIALHTSLVAGSREPEIALVHFGAGLDLIGYRAEDVARATVDAVIARWPRLDVREGICDRLAREAAATPSSPVGVQWRLGFRARVEKYLPAHAA